MAENPYLALVAPVTEESTSDVPTIEAQPTGNPYADIVQQDTAQAVRQSLSVAVDRAPDTEAKLQALARQYNLPVDAVRLQQPEIERRSRLDQLNYKELAERYPVTAKELTNPDKAAIAQDDVENMTLLEQAVSGLKKTGSAAWSGLLSADAGLAGAFQAPFDLAAPLLDPLTGRLLPENPLRRIAGGLVDYRRNNTAAAQAAMPRGDGNLESGYYSGIASLSRNLAALPLALFPGGQGPAMGMMVAPVVGEAYGEATDKGISPLQALPYGLSQGAIEYATERLPLAKLIGDLKVGTPFYETIAKQMALEIPGEQVATVLQDLNEWAVLNPDKPFSEYLAERPDAAVQTLVATIVGTGGQVSVMQGLQTATNFAQQRLQKAEMAELETQRVEQLNELAAASKVLQRDPATFEQFIAEATDDGVENLYIDGNVLLQSGMADQLAAVSPSVAAQLETAIATGGAVSIPVAEYTAHIAPTEFAQGLLDHIRTEPDGFSRAEAQEYMQTQQAELEAEVSRVLSDQQGDQEFKASQDRVKQTVLDELNTLGRFTPEKNEFDATLIAARSAVRAAQLGMTPEAFFEKQRLNVAAQRIDGEQFNQPAVRDQEKAQMLIDEISELGEISDDGLVTVYHRTSKENAEKIRRDGSMTPKEDGLFFSTKSDGQNEGYGDTVVKLRVPADMLELDDIFDDEAHLRLPAKANKPNSVREFLADEFNQSPVDQTETEAFKKWFGDSKVVDENGKPLVVYKAMHPYDFTQETATDPGPLIDSIARKTPFPAFNGGEEGVNIAGFFGDKNTANRFTSGSSSSAIYPVYLSFKNPYVVDAEGKPAGKVQFGEEGREFRDAIRSGQYDGVIIRNTSDEGTIYVALAPEQIKSAIGNRGTFDPNDPSILNQRARGTFNPNTNTIALLKGADLSTFLHEAGHYFFENDIALAAELVAQETLTEGEQQIVNDVTALLRWHGIQGTPQEQFAQWYNLSFEEKRSYHERTAESFEAYLFEGKAPSIELQPYFQQFRAWLLNVYKSLKDFLARNPEAGKLDDEVRAIFDRMLATTEQIQLAEQGRSMLPMFRTEGDAAAIGMTPDEFARYQSLDPQATNDAIQDLQARALRDMAWTRNARTKALKKLRRDAAERRREVRIDVRREVMSQPIYQAWSFLTGKRNAKDDVVANEDTDGVVNTVGRLDRKALDNMDLPPEVVDAVAKRRMTSNKDALHPDLVAEQFGFTSGDELVRKLADVESPTAEIEGLTDARMLELYGELATDEALERQADMAIHNEARARVLATEANALAKAVGQRKIYAPAAKQFAAAMVARLKVRDVRPSQYASAEVKASKAADKARRAGDLAQAAAEKRNQLVNSYATRAAYDAREEVEKGVRYLRKFGNEGTRKNLDIDFLEQIDALLDKHDLRTGQSLKAIDRATNLVEWARKQEEMGLPPAFDAATLQAAQRTHFKNLTVEKFRGLIDAVRNIEHLARLKKKLLTAKDKREFDALVQAAEASIVENAGKARPVEVEEPTGLRPWLEGFAAGHRKFSSLLRQMDGSKDGGIMWELLGRSLNEKGAEEAVMNEKATERLAELYKPVLALKGGLNGDKVFIPEIGTSLTRAARLSVALNWGNSTNRQRIKGGDNWSDAQVAAILRKLTPVEAEFVNNTWEYIDSFWPQVAEKQRRVTGIVPEKVEGEPFQMQLADGSIAQMRGGYYPLKYDANRDQRAEKHDAASVAQDMLRGAFTRATTRRGHTEQRVEEVNRPVKKTLDVITQHIAEVTHDLAWHEWLIDANRLLDSRRINQAIRTYYGTPVVRTMKDMLQAIATADVVPQTKVDQALLYLRANVSRSTMGISLTTALLQPFGLTQSMVRIGPKWVLRGLTRWGGDISRFQNSMTWIGEKSEFMRLRNKTFNRELHEIKGRVTKGHSKARQMYDASLFMLMQKMQMVADVPTWIGAYEKAKADPNNDDARAVAMADQVVLDAQGGGQTKDLAEFQRKHPMLTMFYSYFNVTANLAAESTARTDFRSPMAVVGWMSDMMLLMVIPALAPSLLIALLRGEGDEDDPEEWAKKLVQWQAGYLLGTVIGLREASGLVAGFDYGGPPAGRVVQDLGKMGTQIKQGEVDEGLALASVRLMGTALGIPTVQMVRSWRGWSAWDEGDAPPTAILLGPPSKD
jgi:hypothetical protein